MSGRVLFYVQHLLGIGHLKRAEILAYAMRREGLDVAVALGGRPLPEVPFSGIRVAELPAVSIAGDDFSVLLDASGAPVDDEWKQRRVSALLRLLNEARPDVVLIELFPFGRRQFRFDLLPLLDAIHAMDRRPRVACSVRDILVATRRAGREEEAAGIVRKYFDAVLVHGDPNLIPFGRTFGAAERIADLIRYTGYVAEPPEPGPAGNGEGEVIVAAGGGAVGSRLLEAALAARASTSLADHPWRLITGPNLADSAFDALMGCAQSGVTVERFRADYSSRLACAALSISQAGYNTCVDIVRSRVRAVVVPYEKPGETEQRLRAELLAEKGVLTVLPEADLTAEIMAVAIERAFQRHPPAHLDIDLDGAATTARLVAGLADQPSQPRQLA